jgi:hypothetical protein
MANSLLDQINAEITSILTKLGGSNVPNIGAQVATIVVDIATLSTNVATSKTAIDTLAAQIVTSDAVIDTLTTNVATTKTVVDGLLDTGSAGTGIGPIGDFAADATQDLVALIAQEP